MLNSFCWQSVSDCGLNIEPFFIFVVFCAVREHETITQQKIIDAIRTQKQRRTLLMLEKMRFKQKKILALKVQSYVAGFAAA